MESYKKERGNLNFPEEGNIDSLFQRLSNYIFAFDETWIQRIRPATISSCQQLFALSNCEKWGEIPEAYQIFLKTMGVDDGGLISMSLLGSANIEDMCELYQEFHELTPEVLDSPFFAFFQRETGGELAIDLSDNGRIVATTDGILSWIEAENFEKFLFQNAYKIFGKNQRKYISFGISLEKMNGVLSALGANDVLDIVDEIAKEYGMKKAWFSDLKHYIAFDDQASFITNSVYSAVGFITGENEGLIKELANVFHTRIQVTIQKECFE